MLPMLISSFSVKFAISCEVTDRCSDPGKCLVLRPATMHYHKKPVNMAIVSRCTNQNTKKQTSSPQALNKDKK